MTGRPFDAATLERWGVVNRVFADRDADREVGAIAGALFATSDLQNAARTFLEQGPGEGDVRGPLRAVLGSAADRVTQPRPARRRALLPSPRFGIAFWLAVRGVKASKGSKWQPEP
jgi:enoyl-CoA hydratase/carnithine racemase